MIIGNEDLYGDDIRNYYNTPCVVRLTNDKTMGNNSFPDGKALRRQRRSKIIRKRKGRL